MIIILCARFIASSSRSQNNICDIVTALIVRSPVINNTIVLLYDCVVPVVIAFIVRSPCHFLVVAVVVLCSEMSFLITMGTPS